LTFRLLAGSCSLSKQNLRELLWRVDVERLAREVEDLRARRGQFAIDPLGLSGQRRAIDPDTGALDVTSTGTSAARDRDTPLSS
jgi:hypothetical protein